MEEAELDGGGGWNDQTREEKRREVRAKVLGYGQDGRE
jgi:hypothetical protein